MIVPYCFAQILRQEYIEQKRRWETEKKTCAPEARPEDADHVEKQVEGDAASLGVADSATEVEFFDEMMTYEDEAFSALIQQGSQDLRRKDAKDATSASSVISEEEEDYQQLFMDFIINEQASHCATQKPLVEGQVGSQGMDIDPT